ncbi:hypothetical protein C1H46_028996 [Malus baccata]|uniref:Uncharacterized protein n=1 Tax=Malus baccata TaxID=106549 RepID=A0A540LG73_MALBA|nr:hypothetical protein C1H46_028996 [Malus baccata]
MRLLIHKLNPQNISDLRDKHFPCAFHMSNQYLVVRKVVSDDRNLLEILNPCMQSRQSAWLEQFDTHHFFNGFEIKSQPSMRYVYQVYTITPKKLLVTKPLLFQYFQRFQH